MFAAMKNSLLRQPSDGAVYIIMAVLQVCCGAIVNLRLIQPFFDVISLINGSNDY